MVKKDPPLVDVKVTNPLTYIKNWWAKVMGSEGVDFRFRIHPVTAIAMSIVLATIGFGVGRFTIPEGVKIPFFKYEQVLKPTPEPIWKETAFTGTLQFSENTDRFYLVTTSASEAITLEVPEELDLKGLIGKRIFASGQYNKSARLLKIADAKDLEVLPKTPIPIPTLTPSPTPVGTITPTPSIEPTPSPTSL